MPPKRYSSIGLIGSQCYEGIELRDQLFCLARGVNPASPTETSEQGQFP